MDDLGKYLKEERTKQKISIDEIASHTKIPIRFIQAIENNQFDQIPNVVSAKGFLRGYAQFLGLNTGEISEAFDKNLRPLKKSTSSRENPDEILSYLQVKRSSRLPFPRRVILLVGGVVLLLLIFVGLLPRKKMSTRTPPPLPLTEGQIAAREETPAESEVFVDDAQTTEQMTTSTKEPESKPSEKSNPQERAELEPEKIVLSSTEVKTEKKETPASLPEKSLPAEDEPSAPSSPEAEPAMHLLYVEAIEPTWVQVKIDGDEVREALLQPNDSVRWKAKEKFLLKVGNAGGVRVLLNGNDIGPLGPSGEVFEKEIIGKIEPPE